MDTGVQAGQQWRWAGGKRWPGVLGKDLNSLIHFFSEPVTTVCQAGIIPGLGNTGKQDKRISALKELNFGRIDRQLTNPEVNIYSSW